MLWTDLRAETKFFHTLNAKRILISSILNVNVNDNIFREQYYTCWLALSDSTVENGCIWVLPETHKLGTQPHERTVLGQVGYSGDNPGVAVPLKKGSMAVFSSLLFHRSGPNLTEGVRKSYIIQYIPAHTRNARNNEPFTDRLWIAKDGNRYDGEPSDG